MSVFILKPFAKIYALTVRRVMKARAKSKWRAEMKHAKSLDDLIELGTQRGYEYPVAWAGYQIMKREERRNRKIQEIELGLSPLTDKKTRVGKS